ncbi:MAG: MBL fold metallo-hydrolase [Deltaproteobacteria bacterium]|nr:MAG: MBL fold metallo-hydrolase [Deltaproteobacteria bacterium]
MSENNFNRRDWLKISGAGLGLLGGVLAAPGVSSAGMIQSLRLYRSLQQGRELDPSAGLSLIMIGTGTPIPSLDRACAATLIIAGDYTVLVDIGRGSLIRLAQAGVLRPDLLLFTHFHSDHISDFGELMTMRAVSGADAPLPIIGPPGARKVVDGILEAFSMDKRYRVEHHGEAFNGAGMEVSVTESQPSVVHDQGGLKITMFEVDHRPVEPAVGYKFEYKGKSIVVSGDTIKVPIMTEMAQGCDILVHEAMNKQLVEMGADKMGARMKKMSRDMCEHHTSHTEVAEIARDAGAKKLVLTHMVPDPMNWVMEYLFTRGMHQIYKKKIIVGKDLMEVKA